jgi:glycosyltransferase involved in cell wall biosynthesis
MKILYIAHYKEGSGWSQAAIDYISALDQNGFDVVCRNIQLTNNNPNVPDRILELESKPLTNIDFCIQHVLPHHLVSTKKFKKNIAFFVSESDSVKNTYWYQYLHKMDSIWVPNSTNKKTLEQDGLGDIQVVPHTFDLNKYDKTKLKTLNLYSTRNKFKFYYIGDFNDRKNLIGIIRSFHSEFCHGENVCLVLKIKRHGLDHSQLNNIFSKFSQQIKSNLRLHKDESMFANEVIITANMTNNMIYDLHNTCDCFVNISHGEAWSIPAFEAMAMGNTPICSNEGGPKEFIDDSNHGTGKLINGVYSVCTYSDPAFKETFTGRDNWFIPSELETRKTMRYYFENAHAIDRSAGLKQAEKFSYNNIANRIKDILNEQY